MNEEAENHQRYSRQQLLFNFGSAQQEKLAQSAVLIVGAGGLGSSVALYLAAAGVGKIIICDKDCLELSNLNRQIMYSTKDIGSLKAELSGRRLKSLNPEIAIETINYGINSTNVAEVGEKADLIVDCTDNLETRLYLNSYVIAKSKVMIHGAIDGWNGHLALIGASEKGGCLNCLFANVREAKGRTPVMGAVAGIIGSHQALLGIKYLAGIELGLTDELLIFDGLAMSWDTIPFMKNPKCEVCSI